MVERLCLCFSCREQVKVLFCGATLALYDGRRIDRFGGCSYNPRCTEPWLLVPASLSFHVTTTEIHILIICSTTDTPVIRWTRTHTRFLRWINLQYLQCTTAIFLSFPPPVCWPELLNKNSCSQRIVLHCCHSVLCVLRAHAGLVGRTKEVSTSEPPSPQIQKANVTTAKEILPWARRHTRYFFHHWRPDEMLLGFQLSQRNKGERKPSERNCKWVTSHTQRKGKMGRQE